MWLFFVMLFVQQVNAQTFQEPFEEKFRRYSKGDSYTGSDLFCPEGRSLEG